jgi:hypothetical protein
MCGDQAVARMFGDFSNSPRRAARMADQPQEPFRWPHGGWVLATGYRMTPTVLGSRAYKLEVIHMASRPTRNITIWIIVALVVAAVVIGIVVTAGDGGGNPY